MNVLITGAASGIARKVIQKIKKYPIHIYVTTHTEKECVLAKKRYQSDKNIECFKLDITNEKDRKKIENLSIDVLVCNAAIGLGGSFLEINMDLVRDNFETNVFSNFTLVQMALAKMVEKGGRVIMISSLAGIVPLPFLGSYCATKASIIKITETLRWELRILHKNIDFILIEPGLYRTGFNRVMFDNKYGDEKTLFANEKKWIQAKEHFLLNYIAIKDTDRIARKIEEAILSAHPKRVYKSPFIEAFLAKLYLLFFS